MRRIAFIADIHSNLEALEVVLSKIGGEETYCLGDVVGYGANPNEVIQLLRKNNVPSITGNHDQAAISGVTSGFNARAGMAAMWTIKQLNEESLRYLRELPLERRVEADGVRIYMTHGSPDDPLWEYVDPSTHSMVFDHYLGRLEADAIALGHTHIPFVWQNGRRLVFNPGSVGQPRNGDRRASFATLSIEGGVASVEETRLEYDFERAAAKIREAGLPEQHASRLFYGI